MTSNSFFFNNVEEDYLNDESINQLNLYSDSRSQHIYLLNRPLSEKKYNYTVNKIFIFLSPDYNIQFVNLNLSEEDFEEIYLDFIEDLGHIADKYNYTDIISRPRKWRPFIKRINAVDFFNSTQDDTTINEFMSSNKLEDDLQKRTVKLLISLLTGSINSVEKIGKELPQSTLEKVKQNIILFDGDQTKFIFEEDYDEKIIKIQGLAGTGKTELLLHRLKELYISDGDKPKIAFTCQSRTLANKLKNRVTDFFNFMKVEEQIEWNERLWVMHAWGSVKDIHNLGTYGLICREYQLPFYNSGECSFASACEKTLNYAKSLGKTFEPLFDYMLIDEGQDFTEEFIELCSMVTKNEIFVAGDIFQDIFGIQKIETNPHYLLNKCYRTDPRTLMFSHALGMALYEEESLRFLKDDEWIACGYSFEKTDGNYILNREPVKRFENLDPASSPDSMHITEITLSEIPAVIDTIHRIKSEFPDVTPEDIAIVYTNPRLRYRKIDALEYSIYENFQWNANILYNTKEIQSNMITISNKNNIKGLEFPFVICVVDYAIKRDLPNRNTLYMTLTRSFISSYLIIDNDLNEEIIPALHRGLQEINTSLKMTIPEPSVDVRKQQESIIRQYNHPVRNQYDMLTEIFDTFNIPKTDRQTYREAVSKFRNNEKDIENLKRFIITLMGE